MPKHSNSNDPTYEKILSEIRLMFKVLEPNTITGSSFEEAGKAIIVNTYLNKKNKNSYYSLAKMLRTCYFKRISILKFRKSIPSDSNTISVTVEIKEGEAS